MTSISLRGNWMIRLQNRNTDTLYVHWVRINCLEPIINVVRTRKSMSMPKHHTIEQNSGHHKRRHSNKADDSYLMDLTIYYHKSTKFPSKWPIVYPFRWSWAFFNFLFIFRLPAISSIFRQLSRFDMCLLSYIEYKLVINMAGRSIRRCRTDCETDLE